MRIRNRQRRRGSRGASRAALVFCALSVLLCLTEASAAPVRLGKLNLAGSAKPAALATSGNYAFVGTLRNAGSLPELHVVDVSVPANPITVGVLELDADVTDVALQGDFAYAVTSNAARRVAIVDHSSKVSPVLVGSIALNRPALSIAAYGTRLYVGAGTSTRDPEIYVYSIAQPASPALLGTFDVNGDVIDLACMAQYVFAATTTKTRELLALDVRNAAAIAIAGSFDTPTDATARGVYATTSQVHLVTDDKSGHPDYYRLAVSAAGRLQLSGSSRLLGGRSTDVAVRGGYAFVSSGVASHGLKIVDVASPQPQVVSTQALSGAVTNVVHNGPLAYVTASDSSAELQIFDADLPFRAEIADRNEDGVLTISCLGDSNTDPNWWVGPSWCEQLAGLVSRRNVVLVNKGLGGGTAVDVPDWEYDGAGQMTETLEDDRPDVVVLAFGTNDIRFGYPVGDVVAAYQTLKERAEATGAYVLFGLTPPLGASFPDAEQLNDGILGLDWTLLLSHDPTSLIDFVSPMVEHLDIEPDGIHINAAGQAKRALKTYERFIFRD